MTGAMAKLMELSLEIALEELKNFYYNKGLDAQWDKDRERFIEMYKQYHADKS